MFTSEHKTAQLRHRFHIKTGSLLQHSGISEASLHLSCCSCSQQVAVINYLVLRVYVVYTFLFIFCQLLMPTEKKNEAKGNQWSEETLCSQVNTEMEKPQCSCAVCVSESLQGSRGAFSIKETVMAENRNLTPQRYQTHF